MFSSVEHLFPTETFSRHFIPPAELSSPAGLFSQTSSSTISGRNGEFNSFLQQQSEIYFPQLKTSHFHTSLHAYASHDTISFILRTSSLDTYHALHTANLYFSGRIQSDSHKIQAMKLLPQLNYGRVPKSQHNCFIS